MSTLSYCVIMSALAVMFVGSAFLGDSDTDGKQPYHAHAAGERTRCLGPTFCAVWTLVAW